MGLLYAAEIISRRISEKYAEKALRVVCTSTNQVYAVCIVIYI